MSIEHFWGDRQGITKLLGQKSEYYFLHQECHMDLCRIFLLHAVI